MEQYISPMYELVESCEYRRLSDEMLRDHIVVGIRDFGLSERLQMDANLTLDKAKSSMAKGSCPRVDCCKVMGASKTHLLLTS